MRRIESKRRQVRQRSVVYLVLVKGFAVYALNQEQIIREIFEKARRKHLALGNDRRSEPVDNFDHRFRRCCSTGIRKSKITASAFRAPD